MLAVTADTGIGAQPEMPFRIFTDTTDKITA